jgi:hypothetical protein
MTRVVAAVLVVSVAGCGLTMTTGPDPRRPPDQRPVCTETMDAPTRDGYAAGIGFLTLLVGLLVYKADEQNEDAGAVLMAGGAVTMAVSYASGGVGYYRVKRCQKAVADFERR